ncbi:uncharacterized protein LOC132618095 [Lycium barbarum]|uniref:uncharacterized protein LOC132618095 n=1 Tax=Lycium barbarum TaxID=112863 RepID=UPI00293E79A4|nr:uncharacterized protein LOC132618095 [Lycium barbarum]XP_060189131.1 uncharacterized protein LOC132618095 [Lycium barbarum]XP_060189132.1 uncharacterized protein LOC132618095 [Lycium barbarum]XP_060189133.1 uncharacterized protein LOC132618095 [Lycium barbarum]XP_060189134.1 uncharacterized protein LOC132618095 [Lycium barbarum]XP_060189135.1 uncharacterized protein LOC132618095 [Lycium barbarum]
MLESMWISGVLVLLVSKYSQIKAKGTSMQMVGADWLKSDKQNTILVRGLTYSLALYHMMDTPLEDSPLHVACALVHIIALLFCSFSAIKHTLGVGDFHLHFKMQV